MAGEDETKNISDGDGSSRDAAGQGSADEDGDIRANGWHIFFDLCDDNRTVHAHTLYAFTRCTRPTALH